VADPGGAEGAEPCDDEAAGHHLAAGRLLQRVGFAGEQRLVHLEVGGLDHLAVDDDLVAGTDLDDVVEHEFVTLQFERDAVAPDGGLALADDGQVVERPFRLEFLDDADARVDDDQEPEQ
jgi:hypothetical protein